MNADEKWQRVLARDARSDGSFVYAVRSTGIYCRPSCPSRRPKREQVAFFPQPAAAERAGYRPCRRCHPGQATRTNPDVEKARRACRHIDDYPEGTPTLAALGAHINASPYHLQRTFKRATGISPRQYAEARRLERLRKEMKKKRNVTEALYEAGYGSSSRLYERASGQLGMTPASYRRGGAGATIGFTILPCRLGRLLVAATQKGICRISFGDDVRSMESSLRGEFQAAEVRRDDPGLKPWLEAVLRLLDGWQPHPDLPLDVRATAFQWRVWEVLRSIPRGHTRSYSEVARIMGKPKAARGVARACATNPLAVVVPCHRVVQKNGSLGGYRWGVERKRTLLEAEEKEISASKAVAATAP
jgi:AraC family transcriptional regulator, regulatory protein of adaptative response / methylated-DNA-[protein]-cysteine methyltransferase